MSGQTARNRPAPRKRPQTRGRRRLTTMWVLLGVVAVVLAGVVTTIVVVGGGSSSSSSGQSQAPSLLAPVDTSATGQPVDGIRCETMEQAVSHIHAHLAVYALGQQKLIPAGIGIAPPRQSQTQADGTPYVAGGSCFYWLHSHTQDGIIHIESPTQQTFTLGQYFDIWRQPLGPAQVGPVQGVVTAYVNGQRYSGDPRDIPLTPHAVIQLDVGTDTAPHPYTFPGGL